MVIKQLSAQDTWQLRRDVMWPDKELAFVKLPEDDTGLHYGLYHEGELVSVISLFLNGDSAQFRKFATKESMQGMGFGTKLLEFVLDEAQKLGVGSIWCSARASKAFFYEKFGLRTTEERFERGGIEYVVMGKSLLPSVEI